MPGEGRAPLKPIFSSNQVPQGGQVAPAMRGTPAGRAGPSRPSPSHGELPLSGTGPAPQGEVLGAESGLCRGCGFAVGGIAPLPGSPAAEVAAGTRGRLLPPLQPAERRAP